MMLSSRCNSRSTAKRFLVSVLGSLSCCVLLPVGRFAYAESITPKAPTQLCVGTQCPSSSAAVSASRYVVAFKFVPMAYSPNELPADARVDDIRAAVELGLDGFGLEAYNYSHAQSLMQDWRAAAAKAGATNFKFYLILDMAESTFTGQNVVDLMRTYGSDPLYMRLGGKPLLSAYNKYTADLGNGWWKAHVLDPLASEGRPVTFIPFIDRALPNATPPSYQNWTLLVDQFPSVDGFSLFAPPMGVPFYLGDPNGGHQVWSGLDTEENEARALHDKHKFFISPYQPYYWQNCKSNRPYYEYQGGRGMDNFWHSAITKQKPDIVSLVTWDDYSESTFFQPTRVPISKFPGIKVFPHLGYYELMKYYVAWYKTGSQPIISNDGLFYFYRTHKNAAVASNDRSACPLGPVPDSQKWGLVKDSIYITTALTSAGQLVVKTGSKTVTMQVAAGLNTSEVSFESGTQSFELKRNGVSITNATGEDIVDRPVVYNFNVYSGYSIAGNNDSTRWEPSDKWKRGSVGGWFSSQ